MTGETPAERYVADRMNPEEIAAFEAEMMANPALAADVDVRQRIRAGLEELRERGELKDLLVQRTARRFALPASLAAAALIGVVIFRGFLPGISHEALASLVDEPAQGFSASQALFVMRNAPQTRTLQLKIDDRPLRLRLMPDEGTRGPYTVEFAGDRRVLDATPDGYLDVYLRGDAAGASVYELSVTPATGAPQSFTLNVEVTR